MALLCLLAIGFVANIAVAWWCSYQSQADDEYALRTSVRFMMAHASADGEAEGPGRLPLVPPLLRDPNCTLEDAGRGWTTVDIVTRGGATLSDCYIASTDDFGLPLRSVGQWSSRGPQSSEPVEGGCWHVPPSKHWPSLRTLPVRPLWPGFALNTIFYAALAWGVWQLPLALRRRRRRARNQCPRCGYVLAGLPRGAGSPCPECGP